MRHPPSFLMGAEQRPQDFTWLFFFHAVKRGSLSAACISAQLSFGCASVLQVKQTLCRHEEQKYHSPSAVFHSVLWTALQKRVGHSMKSCGCWSMKARRSFSKRDWKSASERYCCNSVFVEECSHYNAPHAIGTGVSRHRSAKHSWQ